MNIKEIKNDLLSESYYEIEHDSGLKIMVYPKDGYSSTYAVFGTNYGSIDADGIPNGTAHFLEHKLFESEELDAFELFAKTGAQANAYTSFDRTCYLFNCGANFAENLKILINFVQHPYFTQATVEKEQGIIGQEIRMYQDEPNWQVMFNLLRIAYQKHPVRIDIAGTCETIAEITADCLYDCYHKFYNLSNMALACVGNTTVEEVLKVVDETLENTPEVSGELRRDLLEPYEVGETYIEEKMAVAMPLFCFGFKEDVSKDPIGRTSLKEKILTSILLDTIFGETTEFYNELLSEGLISPSFCTEYFEGPGYRMTLFSGDSREPQKVAEAVKNRIVEVKKNGLDPVEFERVRRAQYGRAIMAYNDVDGLANDLILSHFENSKLFDDIDIYKNITIDDATERLAEEFDVDNFAMSVVLPKE